MLAGNGCLTSSLWISPLGVVMADWVRNTVILVVLAIWAIYVAVTLIRDRGIDPVVWGVVPTAYFALNPTWKKGNKDGPS